MAKPQYAILVAIPCLNDGKGAGSFPELKFIIPERYCYRDLYTIF